MVVLPLLPDLIYYNTLLSNHLSVLSIIRLNCFKQHYLWKMVYQFFCLYRPPPNRKNKLTDSLFVEQLSAFLEYCNSIAGCLLILGDFSFHFDHPTDQHVSKILDLFHIFNVAQYVNLPTHTHGHIPDWIVYRPNDNIMVSISVFNKLFLIILH